MSQPKTKEQESEKAPYNKSRSEHFKDLVIAILIASIIAFVSGMIFQKGQQSAIEAAVKSATPVATSAPVKK